MQFPAPAFSKVRTAENSNAFTVRVRSSGLIVDVGVTGTVYTASAPSAAAASEVLTSPNIHDLQVYSVILTVVLCLVVFGGVKIINKVSPAFLIPVLVSLFCIFIGIFTARSNSDTRKQHHLKP